MLNFATTIHDRVYLINGQYDKFSITIEGEDLMRAQVAEGRGAFLMGAHMGSFEIIGSIGRRQPGLQVSMAMYEDNARKINAIFAAINPRAKHDIISLGDEAVHEVTILGERAYLPVGPLRAAALLRRSVIFMLGLYRGGNRYHVVFETIADFSQATASSRDAAVCAAVERYASLLDKYCRSEPYNWFNFFDFWRKPDTRSRRGSSP